MSAKFAHFSYSCRIKKSLRKFINDLASFLTIEIVAIFIRKGYYEKVLFQSVCYRNYIKRQYKKEIQLIWEY